MVVEHVVLLRHSHFLNRRLAATAFIFITFILSGVVALADDTTAKGYSEISGVDAQDWLLYSQDASKIAIVHTKRAIDSPPQGESIIVYSVDSKLQPSQILFEDKSEGQVITEFQWVGNKLFYTLAKDNFNASVNSSFEKEGEINAEKMLEIVSRNLETRIWPNDAKNAKALSQIKIVPPGNIFSSSDTNYLLLFDDLQDTATLWDPAQKRFSDAIFNQRFLRKYEVSSGILDRGVRLSLPMLPARWWGGTDKFVPLFISKDGNGLIAVVGANAASFFGAKASNSTVILLNLNSGIIKNITPDSEINGLRLQRGADPRFFAPGNPLSINGGDQIVCQLSTIDSIDALSFRFGFFDLEGKKLTEVFLLDQDIKKVGIKDSLLVTWTKQGANVLLQDGDIWIYNWQSKQGSKLHDNLWVEDVVGWIDERHLLIRAVPTAEFKDGSKVLTSNFVSTRKKWGILTVPDSD